jgi:hypothetical protein
MGYRPPMEKYFLNALVDTPERNFPVSKNRSRRIHKKLIKRYGGEFKKKVAMISLPSSTYRAIMEKLK